MAEESKDEPENLVSQEKPRLEPAPDPDVVERGNKKNIWSMKLKPGVDRLRYDQQSVEGPFDLEACIAYCRNPPFGPPRIPILRFLSMVHVAGGDAVKEGITAIQVRRLLL